MFLSVFGSNRSRMKVHFFGAVTFVQVIGKHIDGKSRDAIGKYIVHINFFIFTGALKADLIHQIADCFSFIGICIHCILDDQLHIPFHFLSIIGDHKTRLELCSALTHHFPHQKSISSGRGQGPG